MRYVFGKDFTYDLYFYEDERAIANNAIPNQIVTAYVFRESPSRDIARNGTGAQQTISMSHTGAQPIALPVVAIPDPSPDSSIDKYIYWIAAKLKLKPGGTDEIVIRSFYIERVSAQNTQIGVLAANILDIWPDVYSYLTEAQVNSMISLATMDIKDDLSNKGYDWNSIYHPEQLFNALLFNTLSYIYNSQINTLGDRFALLADKTEKRYKSIMQSLKLDYDSSMSGQVTSEERPGILMVRR